MSTARPFKLCTEGERLYDAWWQAADCGADDAECKRMKYWRHRLNCELCPKLSIGGMVAAEKAQREGAK